MNDQARMLREMAADNDETGQAGPNLPAIAIAGGKGGVGKTCMAVNLSVLLAKQGLRPLLVDCDLGLANADVLLGLNPDKTLYDVMLGGAPIGSAILEGPQGIGFIPAASGRDELTRMNSKQLNDLQQELARAATTYDLLVLDLPAGIQREVLQLMTASRVIVMVVTPDPTSLTDAYAQIKLLHKRQPDADVRVLVNQAGDHEEGVQTYNRLSKVVRTYLERELHFLGMIPRERHVRDAIRSRKPFACQSDLASTKALTGVAGRLRGEGWGSQSA